jgi:hypothetical protein
MYDFRLVLKKSYLWEGNAGCRGLQPVLKSHSDIACRNHHADTHTHTAKDKPQYLYLLRSNLDWVPGHANAHFCCRCTKSANCLETASRGRRKRRIKWRHRVELGASGGKLWQREFAAQPMRIRRTFGFVEGRCLGVGDER